MAAHLASYTDRGPPIANSEGGPARGNANGCGTVAAASIPGWVLFSRPRVAAAGAPGVGRAALLAGPPLGERWNVSAGAARSGSSEASESDAGASHARGGAAPRRTGSTDGELPAWRVPGALSMPDVVPSIGLAEPME